jgi:hypothetical protein
MGPVGYGNEAGLLVPGVIGNAVAVDGREPVVDPIAGYPRLEHEVDVASDRVERVILNASEAIKDPADVGTVQLIGDEKTRRFRIGQGKGHRTG